MRQPRESNGASAASAPLKPEEASALAAIALALPDGWIAVLLAPHGQLAIGPSDELPYHTRCWEADRRTRKIRRRPLKVA